MAFEQPQLKRFPAMPLRSTEQHSRSSPAGCLSTAAFDHVEPSDLSQHRYSFAGPDYSLFQYCISSNYDTDADWRHGAQEYGRIPTYYNNDELLSRPVLSTEIQPVGLFSGEPHHFERQLQQQLVTPCLVYILQHGPTLSNIAPTNQNLLTTHGHPLPTNQSAHSTNVFSGLLPQMSSISQSSMTLTASERTVHTELESFGEHPAPSGNIKQYTCEECNRSKSDSKSLKRHIIEVHRKPINGQVQREWFQCACGYQAHYSRKSNYARHLRVCNPEKWMHEFVCQCLFRHTEKEDHEQHYQTCKEGQGRVGRPRRLL